MGTFLGHISSGSMFIALSIFWIMKQSYHLVATRNLTRQNSWLNIPFFRLILNFPLEGAAIMIFTTGGFIGENVHPHWKWKMFVNGKFVYTNVWIHCTIWTTFWIYGFVKVLTKNYMKDAITWVPVFRTFTYFIQCTLFYFHLGAHHVITSETGQSQNGTQIHHGGRSLMNVKMHIMAVIATFLSLMFSAGEIWLKKDKIIPWLRIWASLLNGTWLVQIAFTLFPLKEINKWDEDNHQNAKFVVMLFGWHCMLTIITTFVLHMVFTIFIRTAFKSVSRLDILAEKSKTLKTDGNISYDSD
ncbi:transmembrane protein 45B-like [Anneissia japonica]|uniref:transmembrane protein 45B-like n=1 Tax=Anneissia japonica TaxID=1529436 RepID=UPI001425801D|nr:transmembrane protein 45B-like [Anneissia japonica]XP_033115513.1 transmembrane protein 45B-like [Anneissia japonica]